MTNEKVLIVDDDESVRWVLKKSLEKEGIETVLAKDGIEALKSLEAQIKNRDGPQTP